MSRRFGRVALLVCTVLVACQPSASTSPFSASPTTTGSTPGSGSSPSVSPSVATPIPSAPVAIAYQSWAQVLLPNPAPDLYGGASAVGVGMLHATYVAIGEVNVSCCDGSQASLNRGVVWTSGDGRSWHIAGPRLDAGRGDSRRLARRCQPPLRLRDLRIARRPPSTCPAGCLVSTDGLEWARTRGSVRTTSPIGQCGLVGASVSSHTDGSPARHVASSGPTTDCIGRPRRTSFQVNLRGIAVSADGSGDRTRPCHQAPTPSGSAPGRRYLVVVAGARMARHCELSTVVARNAQPTRGSWHRGRVASRSERAVDARGVRQ